MSDNPQEGVSIEQLLEYVGRALDGDRRLSDRLFWQFQRLAALPSAPPEERALGVALGRILLGDRQPDLSRLDPEAAAEVAAFLARINYPGK
jgi:hypothetical protein